MSTKPRVLLIGWDSADWKTIKPLIAAGKMPNLQRFMEQSVSGNICTLNPILSPMLWTSIATGKRPRKHGVWGFSEMDGSGQSVRPVSTLGRKCKALWNILQHEGKRSLVVGWWPSHPAEPVNGIMVSNHFHDGIPKAPGDEWPVTEHSVHPASLAPEIADCRVHPGELDAWQVLPFVPDAGKIDLKKDKRLHSVLKVTSDTATIQAVATELIPREPWDFMAVYFDGLDHYSHGFMRFHPPKQKKVKQEDFDRYKGVVEMGYRFHDMILGVLLQLVDQDCHVILMSDHGFHPDHLRPAQIPIEPAGPAVEHRPYGILVMRGPGLKKNVTLTGAGLMDVCPTVLTMLGMPVGLDMDGKVLMNAWETPPQPRFIPSWEDVPGECGRHTTDVYDTEEASKEALEQLVALGYIDAVPENRLQAVRECERERYYNLACSLIDENMHGDAALLLQELWEMWPDEHRFGQKLYSARLQDGDLARARETLDLLKKRRSHYAGEGRRKLAALKKENEGTDPSKLPPHVLRDMRKYSARASVSPLWAQLIEAPLLMREGRSAEALELINGLQKKGVPPGRTLGLLGQVHLSLRRWKDALECFNKILEEDPENAEALMSRARAQLGLRQPYEASMDAMTATELAFRNPSCHYVLGMALLQLGQPKIACEAFSVVLSQSPLHLKARRMLIRTLKATGGGTEAEKHMAFLQKIRKARRAAMRARRRRQQPGAWIGETLAGLKKLGPDGAAPADEALPEPAPVTEQSLPGLAAPREDMPFGVVVAGLPRSGTSLMMQMLQAAGVPILTDGLRKADADNPRGYLEFAPARALQQRAGWFPMVKGRAVKIVAQLLPAMPPEPEVRVIMMDRSIEEVMKSQKAMLDRQGLKGASRPAALRKVYERQLERVRMVLGKRGIPTLAVAHGDCIREPLAVAEKVAAFLGLKADAAAMAAVVDRRLHHQKAAAG